MIAPEQQLDPAPHGGDAHHRIELRPEPVFRLLLSISAGLTLLAIAAELSRNFDATDRDLLPRTLRAIRRNFNPSAEQTVGTWFTAAMLLGAGLLFAAIAAATRAARGRWSRHWLGLAAIFVFLSCDEGASLHEQLGDWVKDVMPTGGPLLWAWVVPYSIFAVVVGLAYLSFLRALPPDTRRRFIIAAASYVGGALIIEMIEAGITDYRGRGGGPVTVLALIEETAEMMGVAFLIYGLLHHIAAHAQITLSVAVRSPPAGRSMGKTELRDQEGKLMPQPHRSRLAVAGAQQPHQPIEAHDRPHPFQQQESPLLLQDRDRREDRRSDQVQEHIHHAR